MKCLIWDFDGTLAYHERGLWSGSMLHCLQEVCPEAGIGRDDLRLRLRDRFPWHNAEFAHPYLDTPQKWWDALFPVLERAYEAAGVAPRLARELPACVREDYIDPAHWRLFEDAIPALDGLASRGWTHLVLSNHVPELSSIARGLGLGGRIGRIFNSAETGYEKPHPMAFRGVLDAVGRSEQIWMIGDSVDADVSGAKAAGIPAILVRRRREGVEPYADDLRGVADHRRWVGQARRATRAAGGDRSQPGPSRASRGREIRGSSATAGPGRARPPDGCVVRLGPQAGRGLPDPAARRAALSSVGPRCLVRSVGARPTWALRRPA